MNCINCEEDIYEYYQDIPYLFGKHTWFGSEI